MKRTTAEERMNFDAGIFHPLCNRCAHQSDDGLTCTAFPDGIPREILTDLHDHHEPFPGDHGIQYEPDTSK